MKKVIIGEARDQESSMSVCPEIGGTKVPSKTNKPDKNIVFFVCHGIPRSLNRCFFFHPPPCFEAVFNPMDRVIERVSGAVRDLGDGKPLPRGSETLGKVPIDSEIRPVQRREVGKNIGFF